MQYARDEHHFLKKLAGQKFDQVTFVHEDKNCLTIPFYPSNQGMNPFPSSIISFNA